VDPPKLWGEATQKNTIVGDEKRDEQKGGEESPASASQEGDQIEGGGKRTITQSTIKAKVGNPALASTTNYP